MKTSILLFIGAGFSLALSLFMLSPIPAKFLPPFSYRAICRLNVPPFSAEVLQTAFRDSLVGSNSSIHLMIPTQDPNLVEVVADSPTANEAATNANGTAHNLVEQMQKSDLRAEIIDTATPPLRPYSPNIYKFNAMRGISVLFSGLAGVWLAGTGINSIKKTEPQFDELR
ncbi:MAG: hypothetical protein M3Y82_03815 [Verrucomicrobiota bacterium]|nr:hypothetical protein [Verrucomicrobiota bacterium]